MPGNCRAQLGSLRYGQSGYRAEVSWGLCVKVDASRSLWEEGLTWNFLSREGTALALLSGIQLSVVRYLPLLFNKWFTDKHTAPCICKGDRGQTQHVFWSLHPLYVGLQPWSWAP